YKKIDDNVYIFDGAIEIEQLSKVLSTDIETDEYTETLGGLITNTLGVVPDGKQKLSVTINNILFNVLSVEDRRIIKVKATILPSQDEYNE
ncbi:MAG: transporter associated domain-containing protein, partial [Oscillospiraceae bacterium]